MRAAARSPAAAVPQVPSYASLALFDTFPAMVWRSDVDGLCDYFNEAWLRFRGRSIAQEMGTGWSEGVHEDDLSTCLQDYMDAVQGRRTFALEYRLRRWDGQYRWILDLGQPANLPDGRFAGYIGCCYDITEQKEAGLTGRPLPKEI